MAKKTGAVKKKVVKVGAVGNAYVHSTFNNVIITITNEMDFYGLVDFSINALNTSDGIPSWTISDFLGENYTEDAARKASAITYIDEMTPPFLILHGTKDQVVPIRQSEVLEEALKKHNIYHEVYLLEGAEHGTDEFYQEEVLQKVAAFLGKMI